MQQVDFVALATIALATIVVYLFLTYPQVIRLLIHNFGAIRGVIHNGVDV
jgi:hypothetical protein